MLTYKGGPLFSSSVELLNDLCKKPAHLFLKGYMKVLYFISPMRVFTLLRLLGKLLDKIFRTTYSPPESPTDIDEDDPFRGYGKLELFFGWVDIFVCQCKAAIKDGNEEQEEDDLSFTPPEYENYVDESVENVKEEEIEEELPFCQLFPLGPDMCLMIDHVEMCPDETAFIRVVDEEGYTPLYKRKVRKDKRKERFIVFNNERYYLNDKKTKPIVPKKEP